MKMAVVMAMTAFVSASALGETKTWHVDRAWAGRPGADGSAEKPFGSIQEGVDAAADGDIVAVAPGVYDNGGKSDGVTTSRVFIDKNLTVRATGKKEETHIVGRHDLTGTDGVGPNAVRCVAVDAAKTYTGVYIRGFTLRDGAATSAVSTDPERAIDGGGLYGGSQAWTYVYLVDSVVSNCVARNGGGLFGGTAIRSWVTDCTCLNMGSAGRNAGFWNCLVTGNNKKSTTLESSYCINCTIVGNNTQGPAAYDAGRYRNCILVANNSSNCGESVSDLKGSVVGLPNTAPANAEGAILDAPDYQILGPAVGDYRVIASSAAATSGRVEYMDVVNVPMPANEKYFDYSGKPIDPNAETICAGCLQTAVTPAAGRVQFATANAYTVNGQLEKTGWMWWYPDEYPRQLRFRADAIGSVFCYELSSPGIVGFNGFTKGWRTPVLGDDSLFVMPPPDVTGVVTVRTFKATNEYYVDPEKGDDGNGGLSSGSAFRTLQAAIDAAPVNASKYTVIHCAPGDYDARQGVVTADGERFRAATKVNQFIRIVGAGADVSRIVGAPDTEHVSELTGLPAGCASDSVAGLYLAFPSFVQGFLFTNCYAAISSTDANISRGGGLYTRSGGVGIVGDCTFADCFALTGAAAYGQNRFERCRFFGGYGYNGYFRSAVGWSSCLSYGCLGRFGIYYAEGSQIMVSCTAVSTNNTYELVNSGMATRNCILVKGQTVWKDYSVGDVYRSYINYNGATNQDPGFVDPDSDWHLRRDSGAIDKGATPDVCGDAWFYTTCDIEGKPLRFVNGAFMPGCYQRFAPLGMVLWLR